MRQALALLALLVPRAELVRVRSRVVTVATCHASRYQRHAAHSRLEIETNFREEEIFSIVRSELYSRHPPSTITCWQTLAAPAGLPDPAEVVSIRTLVIALTICNIIRHKSRHVSCVDIHFSFPTCWQTLALLAFIIVGTELIRIGQTVVTVTA